MRVPESSQRRGSEKVTENQVANVMHHAVVRKYLGENFVFDGMTLVSLLVMGALTALRGVTRVVVEAPCAGGQGEHRHD